MSRNQILQEIKQGYPEVADSLFFKIWPIFVKFITPLLILIVFAASFLGS